MEDYEFVLKDYCAEQVHRLVGSVKEVGSQELGLEDSMALDLGKTAGMELENVRVLGYGLQEHTEGRELGIEEMQRELVLGMVEEWVFDNKEASLRFGRAVE